MMHSPLNHWWTVVAERNEPKVPGYPKLRGPYLGLSRSVDAFKILLRFWSR